MAWSDIRHEYESERIGRLILDEAVRAVARATRHYDPVVYGRSSHWADAVDDVVQDLVVGMLLGEGQLDYMMSVSRDLDGFRALMGLQVRRLLARTRVRTVIDNLLERSRAILRERPFEVHVAPDRPELYALSGSQARLPSDDEVWRAARAAALVPRVGIGRSERAPLVYSEESLRILLGGVARDLGCRFDLSHLDSILRLVLTDFLPSFLEIGEEAPEVRSGARSTEEETVVRQAADGILKGLGPEQQRLLVDKLSGVPDVEMARERGVSRPTLAKRKSAIFEVLEVHLRDLDRAHQVAVFDEIGLRLAAARGEA
jgi:hypothetical protein